MGIFGLDVTIVVDVANVMGSRPDGWWRDRAGAAVRLHDQIAELAVPFDLLGVPVGGPVRFVVEVLRGGQGVDRAPREAALALARPEPDFERIMWDV